MADADRKITVSIEARINDLERKMRKAGQVTASSVAEMERATKRGSASLDAFGRKINGIDASRLARQMEDINRQRFDGIARSFDGLKATAAGLGTVLAANIVRQYAEAWQRTGNVLAAAGVQQQALAATQNRVADIAERSRTSLTATADLYAALTRSSAELGATSSEVAIAVETVAKSLKAGGAGAAETSAAILQLGQALGSGALQGDELRSLLENAPGLAKAIAREFGVTTGELKKLGAEGKLTADRVFRALVNAAPEVNKAFASTTATLTDSFVQLETSAARFAGQSAIISSVMGTASGAVQVLARNLDTVANGASALGLIIASRLIAQGLTPMVAGLGAAAQASVLAATGATGLSGALAILTSRTALVAAGANALRVALAFLGGPIGAAILGLAAVLTYAASKSQEGADASARYAQAMDQVKGSADQAAPAIEGVGDAVKRTADEMDRAASKRLGDTLDIAAEDTRNLETSLRAAIQQLQQFGSVGLKADDKARAVELLNKALSGSADESKAAYDELQSLSAVNPSFANAIASILGLVQQLVVARVAAVQLKAELAGIGAARAAADEAAIAKKIPNPTAGTDYNADANLARQDPVLRAIQTQGVLRRAVTDAEADKTTKAYTAARERLLKEVTDAGGAPDLKSIEDTARRIAAIETADKGGGGGRKRSGGKSDTEKHADEVKRLIVNLEEEARVAEAETAAFGQSNAQKRIATELAKAHVDATSQEGQAIAAVVTRIEEQKTALEKLEERQQAAAEAADYLNGTFADAFTDAIVEGKDLTEVVKNLGKELAKAALQAVLFGQGPLAGLLGGGGGLFGGVIKGLLGGIGGGGGGAVDLGAFLYHEGGTVGRGGRPVRVSAAAFAGAPRFHSGLRTDEMAAVLQRGEEVLSRRQRADQIAMIGGLADAAGGGGVTVVQNNSFAAGSDATQIAKMLPTMKTIAVQAVAEATVRRKL